MTPYPIALARGLVRFDYLRDVVFRALDIPPDALSDEWSYFRGVKSFLAEYGFKALDTFVGFGDDVGERARQLADEVERIRKETHSEKVHIVAHSMGGLDARHMLVDLPGMAAKVSRLTLVGAPNYGTGLANALLSLGAGIVIAALDPFIHLDGVRDLTREACEEFDERAQEAEARNSVIYQTYTGAERVEAIFLPLVPGYLLLEKEEGENDGIVSVRSQAWRGQLVASEGTIKTVAQKRFPLPVDHLNECGWWHPHELGGGAETPERIRAFEQTIKKVYLEIAQSGADDV